MHKGQKPKRETCTCSWLCEELFIDQTQSNESKTNVVSNQTVT